MEDAVGDLHTNAGDWLQEDWKDWAHKLVELAIVHGFSKSQFREWIGPRNYEKLYKFTEFNLDQVWSELSKK